MNILSGWTSSIIFSLIVSISIMLASKRLGGQTVVKLDGKLVHLEKKFYKSIFVEYFFWGVIQQLFLVGIYNLLCLIPIESFKPWAVLVAASIFGIMHYPNVMVMFATFAMAQMLLFHWSVYHNIVAIGFAHGLMASVTLYYAPDSITLGFKADIATWLRGLKIFRMIAKKMSLFKKK